jgi:hypothetical protein
MPFPIVAGNQEPLRGIPVALPPAYEYRVRLFLKTSITYQTSGLINLQYWPIMGPHESNISSKTSAHTGRKATINILQNRTQSIDRQFEYKQ